MTGSALAVAALYATTLVPVIVLAPLAGLLADRVESVRLLAVMSLLQAAVAVGLAFTGGQRADGVGALRGLRGRADPRRRGRRGRGDERRAAGQCRQLPRH